KDISQQIASALASSGIAMPQMSPSSQMSQMSQMPQEAKKTTPFANEIGLKLALSRHYLEMGDTANAFPLLDSVLLEGNREEKETAEKLLQDLKLSTVS